MILKGMVMFMKLKLKCRRLAAMLMSVLLAGANIAPVQLRASAANTRFITELRVMAGENAIAELEEDGWSVMMVGLNVTPDPASQVYLAYKTNTGSPVTNVIVSPDVGDSYTDENGIVYSCVSHVDVDEGIEGSAGCIYATRDERAGSPLVGLDVLRSASDSEDVLYPITNDGAEIVRTPNGAPADLENAENSGVVYLAQIRDGIVRPYISEIGIVTDTDKWNAVYTACERGYNYYVEGDIDSSTGTYTIIAYDRTADSEEAITSVAAVSEQTVRSLEITENAEGDPSAAISISGAQYVRVSSTPVSGDEPFYLYMTKDSAAGNPISMLYAEDYEQTQNFLFGMWANSYFFTPGKTTAYTYGMNEDAYMSLWNDQTVCTKIPVQLIDSVAAAEISDSSEAASSEAAPAEAPEAEETPTEEAADEGSSAAPAEDSSSGAAPTEESAAEASQADESPAEAESPAETDASSGEASSSEESPAEASSADETSSEVSEADDTSSEDASSKSASSTEEADSATEESEAPSEPIAEENARYIDLTMLTPRDGLPSTAARLTGLNNDPFMFEYTERTQRSDRVNKYQASVFGSKAGIALIAGGIVIVGAAAFVFFKKRSAKKDAQKNTSAAKKAPKNTSAPKNTAKNTSTPKYAQKPKKKRSKKKKR